MSSTAFDIGYLGAGVEEIESYLLSKNIFWPLNTPAPSGSPPYPRLTLGGLMITVARLKARELSSYQRNEFLALEKKLDHWRARWLTAWERKAQKEFESRLRQWGHYLEDLFLNPDAHIPFYNSEVRVRVLIQLLIPEMNAPEDPKLNKLTALDASLKSIFTPGEFLWEEEFATAFNQDDFWYLWGMPAIKYPLK